MVAVHAMTIPALQFQSTKNKNINRGVKVNLFLYNRLALFCHASRHTLFA